MAIDLNQPAPVINRATLIETTWVFVALATIFFVVRIAVRLKIFRGFMWDDAWVALAFILLLGNAIVTTMMAPNMYLVVQVSLGLVAPGASWTEDSTRYMKLQLANTLLFWSCLWSVKAGFLAFFKRLTDGLNRAYVYAWWAITIVTGLSYIGSVITYPLSCASFGIMACNDAWNVHNSIVSFQFSTCMDIITDALIMALPLALAVRVRIPLTQKLALGGIFSLGIFIIIFSILRIVIANHSGAHPEITWLCLWSAVEAGIAVVVISLASFRALFVSRQSAANSRYHYEHSASMQNSQGSSGFRQLDSSRGNNGRNEPKANGEIRREELDTIDHEASENDIQTVPGHHSSSWPLPDA